MENKCASVDCSLTCMHRHIDQKANSKDGYITQKFSQAPSNAIIQFHGEKSLSKLIILPKQRSFDQIWIRYNSKNMVQTIGICDILKCSLSATQYILATKRININIPSKILF